MRRAIGFKRPDGMLSSRDGPCGSDIERQGQGRRGLNPMEYLSFSNDRRAALQEVCAAPGRPGCEGDAARSMFYARGAKPTWEPGKLDASGISPLEGG